MQIYRLVFKGSGFVWTMPPVGQVIDGFTCTLFLKSSSELAAREAGLAEMHADPTVIGMIKETVGAEVDTWKIECEAVTRVWFWRRFLPLTKRVFVFHWLDEKESPLAT
jgi:hypothetical protein